MLDVCVLLSRIKNTTVYMTSNVIQIKLKPMKEHSSDLVVLGWYTTSLKYLPITRETLQIYYPTLILQWKSTN